MIDLGYESPSGFLKLGGGDREWTLNCLIRHLETTYQDAYAAIWLREQLHESLGGQPSDEWERDRRRRMELEDIDRAANCYDELDYEKCRLRAARQLGIEKRLQGILPERIRMSTRGVASRAVIHALDEFRKFLEVISKEEGSPPAVKKALDIFLLDFPDLREVRNSLQHWEDRQRRMAAKGKSFSSALIVEDGGGFFRCTLGNGELGHVDISEQGLARVRDTLQVVLDAFTWSGPRQYMPA